ncbi:MAG: TIGR03905 family TSCPD domain-containing protein [Eubacteriaceae bacterium]
MKEKHFTYYTKKICSKKIHIRLIDDIVKEVIFEGGCDGNSKGINRLVSGMHINEVITRLEGITCDSKPTSCPDQLSKALKEVKSNLTTVLDY